MNAWVDEKVEAGNTPVKEHFLDENGAISVTFDPTAVKVNEESGALETTGALTGTGAASAKLYTDKDTEFTETVFNDAEAGTKFTVYAGVTVESEVKLSEKKAEIEKPAKDTGGTTE